MQKRNCGYCEKEFIQKQKSQKRIYCSFICARRGIAKILVKKRNLPPLLMKKCEKCFKEFKPINRRSPGRFCSISCVRSRITHKCLLMRKCGDCEKEFIPKQRDGVGKFCSRICVMSNGRKVQVANRKAFLLAETSEERKKRLIERYEKYVIRNGDEYCWDWAGSKPGGYGGMRFDGKTMKAHRVSFEIHNGKIPEGLCCLHICDTAECSNYRHLFLGTHLDNMKDKAKKGRAPGLPGSKNPQAILNESQVGKIKTLLKKGVHYLSVARDYRVGGHVINSIKSGITWKFVKSS